MLGFGLGGVQGEADELKASESREKLPPIRVSEDGTHFVRSAPSSVAESVTSPFRLWGCNYDHDEAGRLLEDYWQEEWDKVVEDFREMKALGANVVRVHLQLGKFLQSPTKVRPASLDRLAQLVTLAERTGLYVNLTGLGCYHKAEVPDWYNGLSREQRWETQALFWRAVARVGAASDAVFCYDLMNEPILPGKAPESEWLAGEFGGKHFVQRIALDLEGMTRQEMARAWVERLVRAIRQEDERHLITVGVIPWALTWPKAKPIFHAPEVGASLDFVSIHVYPKQGEVERAVEALKTYEVGKPLVIEEMFPLKCSVDELEAFIRESRHVVDGWISFYWGKRPGDHGAGEGIAGAITRAWLERFSQLATEMTE
jgi:hypothetical protein